MGCSSDWQAPSVGNNPYSSCSSRLANVARRDIFWVNVLPLPIAICGITTKAQRSYCCSERQAASRKTSLRLCIGQTSTRHMCPPDLAQGSVPLGVKLLKALAVDAPVISRTRRSSPTICIQFVKLVPAVGASQVIDKASPHFVGSH